MNKYTMTCNCWDPDIREDVNVMAESLDDAWKKAKAKFCRKNKVKKSHVNISATRREVVQN